MKLMLMLVGASVLLFLGIFATFIEAGLGTFNLPDLYAYAQSGGFDAELPEVGVPAVRHRRRLSGRSLALPHMVA